MRVHEKHETYVDTKGKFSSIRDFEERYIPERLEALRKEIAENPEKVLRRFRIYDRQDIPRKLQEGRYRLFCSVKNPSYSTHEYVITYTLWY